MLTASFAVVALMGLAVAVSVAAARRVRWNVLQCLVGSVVALQAGLVGALLFDVAPSGVRGVVGVFLIAAGTVLGLITLVAASTERQPAPTATDPELDPYAA